MTDPNEIRAALEQVVGARFTEEQWQAIEAQGYVRAISTGQRRVPDVGQELHELMALAATGDAGTHGQGAAPADRPPLTWEQMEKAVLARTLFGPKTPGAPYGATKGQAGRPPAAKPRRSDDDRRRTWLWVALIALAVIVIVAVVYLVSTGGPTSPGTALFATTTSSAPATTLPPTTTKTAPVTSLSTTTTAVPSTTTTSAPSTTTTALATTTTLRSTYTAQLSGADAVPRRSTSATGTLTFTLSPDRSSLDYVLSFTDLNKLTIARLRHGAAGEKGEEIFTLYSGPTRTDTFTGVAAEGTITAGDLLGPLAGKSLDDLAALIEAGSVYVNVGTVAHPTGEIRGQLE